MWLHPHMGEPDFETLFARSLGYEEGTSFAWLERHSSEFDAVIEIGSNVGVYTVFLDHLARRPETRVTDIYAFEPSPGAFARLNSNLAANQCAHVTCCNVAVAECGGLLPFFEPEGHLTNGSFEREFAAQFTTNVSQRLVPAIAAQALESLFQRHERILIKVDVEGYEPKLISALASIISRYRPIILIEVLESTAAALNSTTCLHAYRAYLLDEGTSQHSRIFAHPVHRDWILVPFA
jgi:FkbM family methyltransferase